MTALARLGAIAACAWLALGFAMPARMPGQTVFTTGVDLVSVPVTVTDASGHCITGLGREDFAVMEDGEPQAVTQFDAERVPVSLGILLDTSGSMAGRKMAAAQTALHRLLFDLLGPDDEVFLYGFDSRATLVQAWTTNRRAVGSALGAITPFGGTAMYDAVAGAIPLAERGTRRKKALVVISDGNDTDSHTGLEDLQARIRESSVLVYAIGIDSDGGASSPAASAVGARPVPAAFPGASAPAAHTTSGGARTGVNRGALRQLTDDSGGRTEIITAPRDLDSATAGIAGELSRQYLLGYVSSLPRDGKWHVIDVRIRRGNYLVRARRGFISG